VSGPGGAARYVAGDAADLSLGGPRGAAGLPVAPYLVK
jgi:hypothetical protein